MLTFDIVPAGEGESERVPSEWAVFPQMHPDSSSSGSWRGVPNRASTDHTLSIAGLYIDLAKVTCPTNDLLLSLSVFMIFVNCLRSRKRSTSTATSWWVKKYVTWHLLSVRSRQQIQMFCLNYLSLLFRNRHQDVLSPICPVMSPVCPLAAQLCFSLCVILRANTKPLQTFPFSFLISSQCMRRSQLCLPWRKLACPECVAEISRRYRFAKARGRESSRPVWASYALQRRWTSRSSQNISSRRWPRYCSAMWRRKM